MVYFSSFIDFSLFIDSAFELPFLGDLLGYIFTNTPSVSLDNSIAYLGCIGAKYKSRGICTTKDNTDQSSITFGLPLGEKLVLSRSFIE
jgi:hypothetical protein